MPPKRAAERPGSPNDDASKRPDVKRSKFSTISNTTSAYPWTNKGIPDSVSFPPAGDKIRISAWNGFSKYVEAEDADILVLTETKVRENLGNYRPADPLLRKKYPHQYWSMATKKGYGCPLAPLELAGTAVLSKHKPLSTSFTLDYDPLLNPKLDVDDVKGRLVTLEFEKCWVIGTYVPNAGEGLKSMDRKVAWQVAFEAHLRKLDAIKPVIWAGDLNVAPTAKDLRNDKSNWNKTPGYTKQETSAFASVLAGPPASAALKVEVSTVAKEDVATADKVETHAATAVADGATVSVSDIKTTETDTTDEALAVEAVTAAVATAALEPAGPGPMIDTWRRLHPKDEHYTYFSYRFGARQKGIGWRIDHFVLSERFFPRVASCEIRNEIWGASDHCPIVMDFEGPL
ncbi:hypothetical protein FRC10_007702 [Ceratobasidium sp. 414]|nr:hypothetical protein FRC10_007702 [Ceratobasidium sp. 414]